MFVALPFADISEIVVQGVLKGGSSPCWIRRMLAGCSPVLNAKLLEILNMSAIGLRTRFNICSQ